VSHDNQRLYVADTNNHCIKVVYLKDKIIEKVTIFLTNVDHGSLLVFSDSSMAQLVVKLLLSPKGI
jgi:sugar lactone lactonase YvrE